MDTNAAGDQLLTVLKYGPMRETAECWLACFSCLCSSTIPSWQNDLFEQLVLPGIKTGMATLKDQADFRAVKKAVIITTQMD